MSATITTQTAEKYSSRPARPVHLGVGAMAPFVLAYAPFGVAVGATAAHIDAPVAGWAGSWLIFGGSAHLAALRTIGSGGVIAAIVTGLLIQTRLLVYSAGLAGIWPHQPRWFRIAAAPMIIDSTFAAALQYASETTDQQSQRRHFLACGLTVGACWSASVGFGALAGSHLSGIDLGIVVPLCLIALIPGRTPGAPVRPIVISSAVVATLGANLPVGTGLIAAMVAGTAIGMGMERSQ